MLIHLYDVITRFTTCLYAEKNCLLSHDKSDKHTEDDIDIFTMLTFRTWNMFIEFGIKIDLSTESQILKCVLFVHFNLETICTFI